MTEISLNNIKKNYGFKNILDEFNLEITKGDRISLIGPNGAGKTTLLKMIMGLENCDDGSVAIRKNASIGMLSQMPPVVEDDVTVKDILVTYFKSIYELEDKMRLYEEKLSSITDSALLEKTLETYGKMQEQFVQIGGYEIEEKISKICNGFKIGNEMLDRKFNSLSGGEKTIINLASLVIGNPEILLLDEPTNHLDIETLEWFENFLSSYKGTILISSHDRYFLDKVVTKTVLIDRGKSEIFHGNYTYYLVESERRTLAEFDDYKNQQKQIEAMKETVKKLKEWGERGDNPRFFKRAASIEKKLEKMQMLDKPTSKKSLPLEFSFNDRSGKKVLESENLGIIMGDKLLLENADMHLTFGETVCLMGKNGSGKSTFIKATMDSDFICDGRINIGSNVNVGYIPQEINFDDNNATVLETARKFFVGSETQLRSTLAKFMFYGEQVFKKVGNLSGGEKVRLKLIELIQKKANLLILDEPTNHIDIDTKEVLEEALSEYKGTVFFISHDRFFINKLATRIINIEEQKFIEYLGNYDDYKNCRMKQENNDANNSRRK